MKNRKYISLIMFVLLFIVLLSIPIYADMGPKDELTVYVKNPPKENYYLDLLSQKTSPYNNFHDEGEKEALNKDMVSLLYRYQSEGWKPALTEGTGVPMWGKLTGEKQGEKMVHVFGYFGLPDTYRIIIVTESKKVTVSDVYTRKALQSSITYDYSTNKATTPSIFVTYIVQFIITFTLTIIIEGIILLLFGFKIKENWKVFLITNFITQIFLTAALGTALIKYGTIYSNFYQYPLEIIILVTETIVYIRFLSGKNKKRKIMYAVVANLTSWLIGILFLNKAFELITKML